MKGFLTNYASAIGLDGKEVLDRYYRLKNEQLNQAAAAETLARQEEPAPKKNELFKEIVQYIRQIQLSSRNIQYIIAGGIGLGIIIALIFILSTKPRELATEAPAPVQTVESQEAPEQEQEPVAPPSTVKVADLRVKTTPNESCWIRLKERDTGKIIEEGTLESGEAREWNIDRPVVLLIGNAGGLMVSVRGGDYVTFGKSGQVVTRTFEPDPQVNP